VVAVDNLLSQRLPLTRLGFADPPSPARGEGKKGGLALAAEGGLAVDSRSSSYLPSPLMGEGGRRRRPGEGEAANAEIRSNAR